MQELEKKQKALERERGERDRLTKQVLRGLSNGHNGQLLAALDGHATAIRPVV